MDIKLTVEKGGSKGKTLQLRSPNTLVGRATGSDVRIPAASVSRRHCRLIFQDGYLAVEDLGSANGTYVNGAQIKKQAVRPGDRLEIGPVVFVVQYQLSPEAVNNLPPEDQDADLVEVEAVDDIPVVDVEAVGENPEAKKEPAGGKGAKKNVPAKVTKTVPPPLPGAKKPASDPKKPSTQKTVPPEEEENVAIELDNGASWHMGSGDGDIRDILSQMEDG